MRVEGAKVEVGLVEKVRELSWAPMVSVLSSDESESRREVSKSMFLSFSGVEKCVSLSEL